MNCVIKEFIDFMFVKLYGKVINTVSSVDHLKDIMTLCWEISCREMHQ